MRVARRVGAILALGFLVSVVVLTAALAWAISASRSEARSVLDEELRQLAIESVDENARILFAAVAVDAQVDPVAVARAMHGDASLAGSSVHVFDFGGRNQDHEIQEAWIAMVRPEQVLDRVQHWRATGEVASVLSEANADGLDTRLHIRVMPAREQVVAYGSVLASPQVRMAYLAQADANRTWRMVVVAAIAVVIGLIAVGWLSQVALRRHVLGPLSALTAASQGIARGSWGVVVPVRGDEEFVQLAIAFNGMAGALQAREKELTTHRDALELEVASRTAELTATIDALPDLLFELDAEERIVRYHASDSNALYVPPNRFLNQCFADLLPQQSAKVISAAMARARATGTASSESYRLDVAGQERHFEMNIACREGGGFICLARDITDRAQLTEDLRVARDQANAASQAKSVFLANMSHEIRTPLNAILGYAQLMRGDARLNDESHRRLDAILGSGDHLLALLSDVLEISKIEVGRSVVSWGPCRLRKLVDEVADMFRLPLQESGVAWVYELGENIPEAVQCDEAKLRQIVVNLVGNAVKYTDAGAVSLRMRWTESGGERGHLLVDVQDSGVGVQEEDQETIFSSFTQGGNPLLQREGTGLGLAISRAFARMLGGDITLDSELGVGSRFRFELPECAIVSTLASDEVPALLRPLSILVVDDMPVNRAILREFLEEAGHSVSEAGDGEEALAQVASEAPELIIMDLRMPVLDGFEATSRLKADPQTAGIPVIALTGGAMDEDRERAKAAGVDGYITKPFRAETLFGAIARSVS
ncbi:MAG: response regulator [Planctomycetota bacterium]|jgi:signal transduction histidine kinase/HAMP domain-containing protein|nr:response regulator [Planctomycetota bacterium]